MPRSRPAQLIALAVGVGAVIVVALVVARLDHSVKADQQACQAVLPLVDRMHDPLGEVSDRGADPSAQDSARASLIALSEEVRATAPFDRAQQFADALEDMATPPSAGSAAVSRNPVAFATLQARTADLLDYCS